MFRPILAAGAIAAALAVSPVMPPVMAQQQSPSTEPPAAQPAPPTPQTQPEASPVDQSLIGLSVYSSDGQRLGEVAEVGMAGGTPAVRVEMGEFLGLGSSSVIVNAKAIARKEDRVEIAMTAAEIKETITKQRESQQQKQKPEKPPQE
jgi:sporulation protein YlmC with PRC-barrel domain